MNPSPFDRFSGNPTFRMGHTYAAVDRRAQERTNTIHIREAFSSVDARIIPVWRGQNLLLTDAQQLPKARFVLHTDRQTRNLSLDLSELDHPWVFLGVDQDGPLFAIDLSECAESDLEPWLGTGEFVDLRRYAPLLTRFEANLLGYARGMVYWHRNHRFCGSCGSSTNADASGHRRVCQNPDCGKQAFPRTDPAVIMLVEERLTFPDQARCLMGRHPRWPRGVYSTLAGFVEPGESLEQAVAREVFEEAGIRVEQVRYLASQPWSYPSSLMIGFESQAKNVALSLDTEELEDARWFTVEELRAAGEWDDTHAELRLPRADSIARFLIHTWLTKQRGS